MSLRSGRRCFETAVCVALLAAIPVLGVESGAGPDLPDGVSADWWGEVQRSIQLEQYGIAEDGVDGAAFRATNPAHRFEARFDASGMRLATLDDAGWEWGLSLYEWGRPHNLEASQVLDLRSDTDRVELDRGSLTEWFVNTPQGLEHGFTVPARPRGTGDPLVFDLAFVGGLHAVFAEDGQAIDLYSAGNVAVLRYGKLVVIDATGEPVPARMEPIAGGVRIAVDDSRAVYPLTVDPLATSASWTAAGEAMNNHFGVSVSTAGDVNGDGYSDVLVGADRTNVYRGKAYLYLGTASGLSAAPSWTAAGEAEGDGFGGSVATAGDVNGDGYSDVVIGARNHNDSAGKAYLYLGGASGLSATASWTAVGQGTNHYFGYSVATAGDVNGDGYSDVVVGAFGYSTSTGRAHLYLGGPGGLSATPSWTATGEVSRSRFGRSVATAGDVNGDGYSDVVVGASDHDVDPYSDLFVGKAYLYLGGASGLAATPSWTAVGENRDNHFAESAATAGDVNGDGYSDVVIGAYAHNFGRGKAYLYLGTAAGLSMAASWTVTGTDSLGCSVATAGDVNGDGYSEIVIGSGVSLLNGKSYMYLGSATGLPTAASWTKSGEASGSSAFGKSVAAAGDINGDGYSDVVIGDDEISYGTGKAYVFLGGASGPSTAATWVNSGETSQSSFGFSLGTAGDVNGDGYSDIVVGSHGWGTSGEGRAYLYLGGSGGLATTASWTTVGEGGSFAWSVGTAGDVNGDGYSDVIIGAPDFQSSKGKAYVYLGGATGLAATASWTKVGETDGDKFGYSVSTAGDVNGDGYSDVVVGAHLYSPIDDGKAYLYLGGASGLSTAASWTTVGVGSNLGHSVSTAGDVNGDGYSDVLIGAYADATATGKAYVFHGSPSGLSATASWTKVGQSPDSSFGWSVSTAGDVNGDGFSDVLIGAYNDSGSTGKAFVFLGGVGGLATTAWWTATGQNAGDTYGHCVSTAGDVNGDGYSDVVVGAQGYATAQNTGKAYLYLGSASGLSSAASWTAVGQGVGNDFGHAVASAGDVNGDGYSDVVASASGYSANTGRVYLYPGGWERGGVAYVPRQLRSDQSAPVSLGGVVSSQQFRPGLTLRSPVGRVKRWMQWQVAKWGTGLSRAAHPVQSDASRYDAVVERTVPVSLEQDLQGYVWRARVRYDPSDSPFVPWSRWFTMAGNGLYEADLFRKTAAPCVIPVQEVYIPFVSRDPGRRPILTFEDPNPSTSVTGYNVYRADAPEGPWFKMGSNVTDSDPATPGVQWLDPYGGGAATWYYRVAAFNGGCAAEGPW